MRNNKSYLHINDDKDNKRRETPWYWRLIALAASWMILCGYLMLPGLYAKDAQLKISPAVLSVFVVAFLTAGYSFTALLCFACSNLHFQAEGIFLPALTSSFLGLISIAYNFSASKLYVWGTSAITGTVVSSTATLLYGALLLWTHRRITKSKDTLTTPNYWSSENYYSNFNANMYPTSHSPSQHPEQIITEDDRVNAQMALLLTKSEPRPSADANSATYRIDLPEDREQLERIARSQELVGTPGAIHASEWPRTSRNNSGSGSNSRARADSRPDNLSEHAAWERWQSRGRSADRPASSERRAGQGHSRNVSREERRREIEAGR